MVRIRYINKGVWKLQRFGAFFVLEGTAFRCFILVPVPLVRLWGSIGTRIPIWDVCNCPLILYISGYLNNGNFQKSRISRSSYEAWKMNSLNCFKPDEVDEPMKSPDQQKCLIVKKHCYIFVKIVFKCTWFEIIWIIC